jgi:Protein of unknown function (DUF2934)
LSSFQSKESKTITAGGKRYVKMSSIMSRPSESEVRTRAYQIFERNGRQGGCADQDWLQAEQELLARHR